MPILTIQNQTFNYPDPGTDPGWGEESSAWAQAVTDALNTLIAPGDILETSFTLQDNITTPTLIVGLRFDSALVRAANVTYSINRNGQAQSGTLHLNFNISGATGQKWTIQEARSGEVGIIFSVNDTGQVSYQSSATGSTSNIKFSARTLSQ